MDFTSALEHVVREINRAPLFLADYPSTAGTDVVLSLLIIEGSILRTIP